MSKFIGRTHELETLERLWQPQDARLLIVYGRRRVGKTRLLTHWLNQLPASQCLYWVAQPSAAADQLRQFSQAIVRFENPDGSIPATFTYQTWGLALEQVARLAETRRFALVIDEFTYLLARTPSIAGLFQNTWDHLLKQRNLLLILCGSHLGMMHRHVLSYQAPLYGRASAQLHVQPLPFGISRSYFPNYSAAERVAIYSIFGGIPAYWERIAPEQSIATNIRQQLLTPNNLMQSEPRLLLQDFVKEPDNYVSVLSAISNGYRTQKEMMAFSGLAQGHVSSYVSTLESAGFVERRVPITAGPRSRQSRYHVTDPYLRFYYRFLASRQPQLALGVQEPVLKEIQRHLLDFIGTYTWEELCREWVLRAGAKEQLPIMPDQVGSYWDKTAQLDVVGLNRMEKTLVLGECKWSPKQIGQKVIKRLLVKTAAVVPKQGAWHVYYVGMARGGWSEGAQTTLSVQSERQVGSNWRSIGGRLVNLAMVDDDLYAWSR